MSTSSTFSVYNGFITNDLNGDNDSDINAKNLDKFFYIF